MKAVVAYESHWGNTESIARAVAAGWSPGGATGAIDRGLAAAGYPSVGKGRRFTVKGKYGPLRDGEIELARQWGAELAEMLKSEGSVDPGSAQPNDIGRTDEGAPL